MTKDADDQIEKKAADTDSPSSDKTVNEAHTGMQELLQKAKSAAEEIKRGLRQTGISDQFGKPLWLISEASSESKSAPGSSTDTTHSKDGSADHWFKPEQFAMALVASDSAPPQRARTKGDIDNAADEVHHSLRYWNQTDRLNQALEGKTPAELQEMDTAFKQKYKMSMEDYIRKEAPDEKRALELLSAKDKEHKDPEKDKIVDLARKQLGDTPPLTRLKQDVEDFEHRQPPVSAAERSRFYHEVTRLLEASGDKPLTQSERTMLARDLVHNAAHPTDIDQGRHNTCNVSTVEVRMYTREPAAAARLVTDVATTGKYSGKTSQVDFNGTNEGSLRPDYEAGNNYRRPGDNNRNYASQIFQVTAVNLEVQKTGFHVPSRALHYPPGTVQYEQGEPTKKNPSGERLVDKSTGEQILVGYDPQHEPGLTNNQLNDVYNEIGSNTKPEKSVIERESVASGADTIHVKSEQELKDKLEEMKKNGELPAIIWVDSGNSPFWGDGGSYNKEHNKGGDHGPHVVSITDYDPATGRVSVDNQWGSAKDHGAGGGGISIGDLYAASNQAGSAENIKTLDRDVAWNRQEGHHINTFKELELLRQKRIAGKLTDETYQKQVEATMKDARERWKNTGRSDNESEIEKKQAEEHYSRIMRQIRVSKAP